jgi:FKBP-type peptidyl-prolyl cis-trans isomerase
MGRLVTLGFAVLAVAGCGLDATEATAPSIENTTFAPSLGVDLTKMTKRESGLYYRDLVVGPGAAVARGQLLKVHYTGWLASGFQFDSNGPNDAPFQFVLGAGQVIGGWDDGLVGMNVGGTRQLVIPPSLGYGSSAVGPIPRNSILIFTVDVVSAQSPL